MKSENKGFWWADRCSLTTYAILFMSDFIIEKTISIFCSGMSPAEIAGIAVGCVLLVLLVGLLGTAIGYYRKRRAYSHMAEAAEGTMFIFIFGHLYKMSNSVTLQSDSMNNITYQLYSLNIFYFRLNYVKYFGLKHLIIVYTF